MGQPGSAASARESAHGRVAKEILEEIGSAFARANEKVDVALQALERARGSLAVDRSAERVAAFNKARACAANAIWELRVHREALGMVDHRQLEEGWKLPDPA